MRRRVWIAVSLLGGLCVTGAHAIPPPREEPERLKVQELLPPADLIFQGSVVSIEYRSAEPEEPDEPGVPHTFVTYRVDRTFKGAAERDTFTLRFLGGPLDADRFVYSPEQPLFDVGDTDVLMVNDNASLRCPLVNCAEGRFRLIDGRVVNEQGQRIQVRPDGDLRIGPALNLPGVLETRMSDTIQLSRIEVGEPAPGAGDPGATFDPELDFTPAEFLEFIQIAVEATHSAAELEAARARPAASADIRQPFWMPKRRQVGPAVADAPVQEPRREERRAVDVPSAASRVEPTLPPVRDAGVGRRAQGRMPGSYAWASAATAALALALAIGARTRQRRGSR